VQSTVTRIEQGITGRRYTFGERIVSAVTSLEYADDVGAGTWTAVDADDYELRTGSGPAYLRYPAGFSEQREYRITYTTGYADTAIPRDVQWMLARICAIRYFQSPHGGVGLLPHQISKGLSTVGGSSSDVYQFPQRDYNALVSRYRYVPRQ
jgi:hypothetical protein